MSRNPVEIMSRNPVEIMSRNSVEKIKNYSAKVSKKIECNCNLTKMLFRNPAHVEQKKITTIISRFKSRIHDLI